MRPLRVFKRVLMVCIGNICRSPTAEVLLRHRLQGKDIVVESAGLAAMVGKPIDPVAQSVLTEHGLTGDTHVARQLDRRLIDNADLILVMERKHLDHVHQLAPHSRGKSFLLGKWQDDTAIPDPYRKPREAFEQAFQLINSGVSSWGNKL